MQYNSRNLVALTIGESAVLYPTLSYEWPELPNLKELIIHNSTLLHILFKYKDTLISLEYHGNKSFKDLKEVVVMPKLTELYLEGPHVLCEDFLDRHKQNLKILILSNVECDISFNKSLKMESMKTVVLLSNYGTNIIKYTNEQCKLGWKYSNLCPNAQVIFVTNSHKKKKGVILKSKQQIMSLCKTHKLCVNKIFTIYSDKFHNLQ